MSFASGALAAAVAVAVTLRAVPFAMTTTMRQSDVLDAIGRWMPLGAITILAIYCLSAIDITTPSYGLSQLTGAIATVAIHWWRRNAVLSIVTGTGACLVMANWILPT